MTLDRARVSALAVAVALTMAVPAAAQNRPAQPAQPAAAAQPAAPEGPKSGPNALVVSHTLTNLTTKPVQVQIRMDDKELFSGRLEGRRPAAPEDEPSPQIKPVVIFDVPQEKTLFWEVLYTAIEEEQRGRQQQARPEAPKFCRQAWTAVVAPGASEPEIVIPVQPVNQFGDCDFAVETTEEEIYDVAVKLSRAPQ